MATSARCVQIHSQDNVAIATADLPVGTELSLAGGVTTREPIGLGHKFAIAPIEAGAAVLKYGQPIGLASRAIAVGDWVHIHNVSLDEGAKAYEFGSAVQPVSLATTPRTFAGYRRSNGGAGTRNYIAVISSVNCSASVSKAIARHFDRDRLAAFPQIDGVVAFTHHGGCAMQFGGMQHQLLNRVMGGIARHPNIGGYVLIGLGCEKATIEYLVEDQRLVQIEGLGGHPQQPPVLTLQNSGGTAKTIAAGIAAVEQLLPIANQVERVPIPASELMIATQCGGSDGSSGITANPALGVACDLIVEQGGTAILGETTEMVGAEHLLTRRAVRPEIGQKLLERIEWWRWYAGMFGETIDDNRSAGNAKGGLTTIAEKSLGAVAKGGSTPLR
ncbi:MAG: UxaA family hydrolase, partial [Planctomycetales bacterium]|nr:UxaA family hydrolase [Planctomycetales bacterium]